ncbi:MAG: DinB family protein [Bacteroidota bacterium]
MTKQEFLEYLDWVLRPCEALMKLAPDDKLDYAPVEGMFTLGQLLHHLALSLGVYARGFGTGDWGVRSMREIFVRNRRTEPISGRKAAEILEESKRKVIEAIQNFTEDEFHNNEVDSPMLGRQKIWRLCVHMVEHQLNHKEQLFLYLKLLGIKVHTGTLYIGST